MLYCAGLNSIQPSTKIASKYTVPGICFNLEIIIIMIVIRMPNDGVCPIQVVTQDADMAENINFNG